VPPLVHLQAMRWHHWPKNLLVFAPLLVTGGLRDPSTLVPAVPAFVAFCLAASAGYLLNDVVDLPHDRSHPTKRRRPLASGRMPLRRGVVLAAVLLAGAALVASALPAAFGATLAAYVVLMGAYTLRLKRIKLVDALTLGVGYTLRVLAGAAAVQLAVPWPLLGWSLATFAGLALLKRRAELTVAMHASTPEPKARAYRPRDLALIDTVGRAADLVGVLALAGFAAVEVRVAALQWAIWGTCALQLAWTGHLWRMAVQGRIVDDPVAFALRDPASGVAGALLLLLCGLATWT
jgi:4-hydroxybenzoate polyprenyltransferase